MVEDKNLKNTSADVFSSSSFRADVMALRLKTSFHASPAIITRCYATKDNIRGKTPFRFALLKNRLRMEVCYLHLETDYP